MISVGFGSRPLRRRAMSSWTNLSATHLTVVRDDFYLRSGRVGGAAVPFKGFVENGGQRLYVKRGVSADAAASSGTLI